MSGLVDKINEMIDILHEIDPAAAAQFRSGAQDQRTVINEAAEVVRNLPPFRPVKVRSSKKTAKANTDHRLRSSEPMADLLRFELKSEKLIEGIIFSEIIGSPVSKRHGGRRF